MNLLDDRLSAYHHDLVTGLACPVSQPRARPHSSLRVRHYVAATLLGLVLATAVPLAVLRLVSHTSGQTGTITVSVSGFTVVEAADRQAVAPRISGDQAASVALNWLARPEGAFPANHGFRVIAKSFHANVYSVRWIDGSYITTGPPENLWLIALEAPGRGGWQRTDAHVLVDGDIGKVSSAQQYSYNCPSPHTSPSSDYPACP